MKFPKSEIEKLKSLIASPKKTVIVTHRNPDGDAVGSTLGWKYFLENKKFKDVTIISPTSVTENLRWMRGMRDILAYESEMGKKLCEAKIKSAEFIFCLDFNSISRLEELGEAIKNSSAPKVMIDHHQQPENFAEVSFSDVKYCATSEMIYDVIADLGETELVDEKIAECLYVGLATDNGFFQFNNTTPNAHMVAAALIAKGAKPDYVSDKVNNVFHEQRLRFFGYCLNEKLRFDKTRKVAYILASQTEIKKYNLRSGDSESLVNYPFKIEGVQVTAYFSEEPDRIKISFRSRGEIDVNEFARTNFEGGGHRNAAGGKSFLSLEKTEKRFLDALDSLKLK